MLYASITASNYSCSVCFILFLGVLSCLIALPRTMEHLANTPVFKEVWNKIFSLNHFGGYDPWPENVSLTTSQGTFRARKARFSAYLGAKSGSLRAARAHDLALPAEDYTAKLDVDVGEPLGPFKA